MHCVHSMLWGGRGGGAVSASPTSCLSSLKGRGGGQGFSAYISKQVFTKNTPRLSIQKNQSDIKSLMFFPFEISEYVFCGVLV